MGEKMTLEQVLDLLDSALAGQTGSRVTIHATRAKKARDAIAAHLSSSKATAVDSRRIDWLESECTQAPDEYGMARQLYFGTYSSGQTLRDAIDAYLLSQAVELADYKNASLHAADDCVAKDAEIARLQSRLAAIITMRNKWERDAKDHLMTFGQHMPASLECLIEIFDKTIQSCEREDTHDPA